MKNVNVTEIGPIPENIANYCKCLMLHKKKPVWNGDYIEVDGIQVRKIKYICDICDAK